MKYLIVFGSEDYKFAKQSLVESAAPYFDHCFSFSKEDIEEEFYQANSKILDQKRGAGYWLWKPYFIFDVLNSFFATLHLLPILSSRKFE